MKEDSDLDFIPENVRKLLGGCPKLRKKLWDEGQRWTLAVFEVGDIVRMKWTVSRDPEEGWAEVIAVKEDKMSFTTDGIWWSIPWAENWEKK